jgi:hypothetical protein
MTASNNDASNALSFDQQPSVLNFTPSGVSEQRASEAKPEDTQELPVHPGIPVEETPSGNSDLLKELQRVANLPSVPSDEVLQLFETFVRVARNEPGGADLANKNAEIGQLKELLLEAQETIISLLNDRVLDRAKMAKLEAEVRLLPDLQSQATRAMGLAIKSEDVQGELETVRAEVERLRTSYMRTEHKKGFFARLFGK